MHPQPRLIRFALPLGVALMLSACGGAGPGWTYAPLGPSAAPTQAASATPSSSSAAAVTLQVKTTDASPLAFDPAMLEAPAGTVVQVDYLNDSSLPHNIHFFAGSDSTAASLGMTDVVTGPGQTKSVTFTTPSAPGDYYFWCDVHQAAMSGMLHVTP
ncbi:MAG: plastocyanin/azurin family copper-binding protein [Chloroflexota bacterium]